MVKVLLTERPIDFQDMVLKIYTQRPPIQEIEVVDTVVMSNELFIEFASGFQKPFSWPTTQKAFRVVSEMFPLGLVVKPAKDGTVQSVGFEITED